MNGIKYLIEEIASIQTSRKYANPHLQISTGTIDISTTKNAYRILYFGVVTSTGTRYRELGCTPDLSIHRIKMENSLKSYYETGALFVTTKCEYVKSL